MHGYTLHPLPPLPKQQYQEQGWNTQNILDDPFDIQNFKEANNIDPSIHIDLIVPGRSAKFGDFTNRSPDEPMRKCFPCRCHTQAFENNYSNGKITLVRKQIWIEAAIDFMLDAKERSMQQRSCGCSTRGQEKTSCSSLLFNHDIECAQLFQDRDFEFWESIKEITRADLSDEYDLHFEDVPDLAYSTQISTVLDCGMLVPCQICQKQIFLLGLGDDVDHGRWSFMFRYGFDMEKNLQPFTKYLEYNFGISELYSEMEYEEYTNRHLASLYSFHHSDVFLRTCASFDWLKYIDGIMKERDEVKQQNEMEEDIWDLSMRKY
jgi:hypothetical protein